jgi:iron complex outermembrane receptor protein
LPIASESGLNSQLVNAGEIQNKGIELMINATPIKRGKFEWNTSLNYTRNRNKILDLVEGTDTYQLALGFGADVQSIAKVGEQYGTLVTPYGYAAYKSTDPTNPANGQRVIGAASGTTGGYPSYLRSGAYGQGSKVLGTMMENFLASNLNNVRYGNFTATLQLDGKFGGLMGSGTHQYGSANGSFANSLFGRDAETGGVRFTDAQGKIRNDGIIPEGVLADGYQVKVGDNLIDLGGMPYSEAVEKGYLTPIPAFAYYDNLSKWGSGIREYSVFENSWVSLREVSVGYNVPASVLEKIKVQSLRVSVVGRNLIYLYRTAKDGINPEGLYSNRPGEFMEYGGLPFSRNLGVSINVGL